MALFLVWGSRTAVVVVSHKYPRAATLRHTCHGDHRCYHCRRRYCRRHRLPLRCQRRCRSAAPTCSCRSPRGTNREGRTVRTAQQGESEKLKGGEERGIRPRGLAPCSYGRQAPSRTIRSTRTKVTPFGAPPHSHPLTHLCIPALGPREQRRVCERGGRLPRRDAIARVIVVPVIIHHY